MWKEDVVEGTTVTVQAIYQRNHLKRGLCRLCSEPLCEESNHYCKHHHVVTVVRARERMRRVTGVRRPHPVVMFKEWEEEVLGGGGR